MLEELILEQQEYEDDYEDVEYDDIGEIEICFDMY